MKTSAIVLCGTLVLASMAVYAAPEPFVGMELRPLGPEVASYLGLESGVIVGAVLEKSPAEAAGLKPNDIIVMWNGEAVAGPETVIAKVKASTPGEEAKIKVLRKGVEHELTCKVGTRDGAAPASPAEAPGNAGYLGIAFDKVPEWLHEYLGMAEATPGVYVIEVLEGSPAAKAGLKERDIICKVDGKDVASPEEMQALMSGKHANDAVKIEGLRAGRELEAEATLAARPANFEKKMRRMFALPMPGPGAEKSKDQFTLRFKDQSGKEHVYPFPGMGFGREFNFEMPKIEWPNELNKEQVQDLEARVKEAMKEAMKRIEEHSRQLKENHGAFMQHMKELKGAPAGGQSVVVSESASQVTSNDGTHEITVKTENGVKTVCVKEGDKVLAKDMPLDQLGTLPDAVQKKVKELDGSVIIKTESHVSPAPVEKQAPKTKEHKQVDVQVPTRTL